MPRFFDDYSNTYLTHDSSAGRKQQRRGWKFRENFKMHYGKYKDDWMRGGMGLASAQQGFIKAVARNPTMAESAANVIPPLPAGWKEEKDDVTGLLYYIELATKKRTWVRPGFIPPPPPQQRGQLLVPPPATFMAQGPPPQARQSYYGSQP